MTKPATATLIVMRSSSKCAQCGLDADPDEIHHVAAPGDYYRRKGCGAKFTAITTDAVRLDDRWRAALASMRPDLTVVEYEQAWS
jgi:hypothetical protein